MIGVGTDIVNFSHLRAITLVQEDPFIQKHILRMRSRKL